jgi:hypothetical protein
MNPGNYNIINSTAPDLCLGASGGVGWNQFALVQQFPTINPEMSVWVVENTFDGVPRNFFLRYAGFTPSRIYLRFGQPGAMAVVGLDISNIEFTMHADDVGDGLVAINNHDGSLVADANGDTPVVGAPVTPWGWNGGGNQKWRFIPVT